jgi:hypothetical protein
MTGIVDFRTSLLDENDAPINALNPLPTTGGGGGGMLSDTVFVDSTGQLFVYRDTGAGTPSAFSIPSWGAYTPIGAVTAAPVSIAPSQDPLPVTDAQLADIDFVLTRMLNALNAPQGYDKSLQRQRGTNIIESGTVTTVSTVTTLTNLSTVDTLQGRIQVYGANLSAWADTVRARIT